MNSGLEPGRCRKKASALTPLAANAVARNVASRVSRPYIGSMIRPSTIVEYELTMRWRERYEVKPLDRPEKPEPAGQVEKGGAQEAPPVATRPGPDVDATDPEVGRSEPLYALSTVFSIRKMTTKVATIA